MSAWASVPQPFFQLQHTLICPTHDDTPQNVASRNEGMKPYMAINMYLHFNTYPIIMQAYENKTLHMMDKTVDDKI
jgi:hypothetical protein